MLDHDVVHPGGRWGAGEARERERSVGIGDVLVEEDLLPSARAGNEFSISHRGQVGEHTDVLNGGAVGDIAKLPGDGDGVGTVASHRQGGNGLVDDFNLFCRRARVKGNPTKVGVAVGAVLLKSDLRPGRCVGGIHGVSVARPRSANVAGDLSGRQPSETSHGHKGGVELSAGAFLERFKDVERDIHRAAGS